MYSATMRYEFTKQGFERGCALWREIVFAPAKAAPGLIRMQFLTSGETSTALAIGTWREKSDAEAFMRTGIFKRLTESIADLQASTPHAELWNLDSFHQA